MKIELTSSQTDCIVKNELEARLAICNDARLKMALEVVLENYREEENADELQGIVATTAC